MRLSNKYGVLLGLFHPLTASRAGLPQSIRHMPVATAANRSTCASSDFPQRVQRHRIVLSTGPQGIPTEYISFLADRGNRLCSTL